MQAAPATSSAYGNGERWGAGRPNGCRAHQTQPLAVVLLAGGVRAEAARVADEEAALQDAGQSAQQIADLAKRVNRGEVPAQLTKAAGKCSA